ncbi:thiamine pyrophosphate-binding protein [Gulosibacter macacae]|uniref:Thiamine pyrophosphate-binding protein n=1 Tax=Gulosibacter macacae TaxID=2488791 RepID=A0A3P3VW29_9MICO|nr:thiamine pyrophosphate-binding protein [Gulosibacter macacae]RRJ86567.1 thiamine pyrophosphate-binding protein [Gulosibacter macacae]
MTGTQDRGERIGGDLVLESLVALGATGAVGLPGQHALGLFDAFRRVDLPYLGARVENNAGFMADGLARVSGTVAPLLLSTGPGALTSLAALQEAAASSIPVLAISAQVPVAGLGGGRHGYLHELPDQSASFRGVVKHVRTVRTLEQIVPAMREAWVAAASAPTGPVLVEIPQDVLLEAADRIPAPRELSTSVTALAPQAELIERAAELLAAAERPAILAGGGVMRAGEAAQTALVRVAELAAAPVVTTVGGKGAFPPAHPLSAAGWIEDIATTELLEGADVLLIIGSGLGELSSNYHTFAPQGTVIQIEADLGKIASNHAGLGIHADAALALAALAEELSAANAEQPKPLDAAIAHASDLKSTVVARLDAQSLEHERGFLAALRDAVPDAVDSCWDMTIAAYWAWSCWDAREGRFASAQGSGGLGYGLPAAIGMAFGHRVSGDAAPVLAVSGDGGALYGIAELATLAQEKLPVTWCIVDDGGYGVLREYMEGAFGAATATELARPDYVQLAASFGVAGVQVAVEDAGDAIAEALASGEPRVVVVRTHLDLFAPTHLDRVN